MFAKKRLGLFMYYSLQHFWHKWEEGDWTEVLGICFRTFLKKGLNFAIQGIYRKKLADCRAMLLSWLTMMHRLLERFLKDHWCLEPYFHQNFSVFWIPYPIQFQQIITFPSNQISCNSYSLIVFQNYSEILLVLTQAFPLMRSKVSAIDSESNNKPFMFLKHVFDGEFLLLDSPIDFKVCQSCFRLAIFYDSFSSRYTDFSSVWLFFGHHFLFVDFPIYVETHFSSKIWFWEKDNFIKNNGVTPSFPCLKLRKIWKLRKLTEINRR